MSITELENETAAFKSPALKSAVMRLWPEAGRYIGAGRSKVYDMARAGELPTIRIGRKYVVPKSALDRWLDEQTSTAE